jgi:hypothetical protein
MGKPRRIHLASQCYIRRFAASDRVSLRDEDYGRAPAERRVASVGWRPGWWGSDAALSEEVETILRQTEQKAAPILREIELRWPLGREDRAQMAQFVAIHAVRGPAWRDAYDIASMLAIGEELRRHRWGDRVERLAFAEFVSDPLRAEAMLKDVPRIASILMSMCWSLVKFDEPLLGSCDQPVVWFPLLRPSQRMPVTAIPRSGFMDTIEVRFPLDSRRVLLLTWAPQPDLDEPIAGEFRHAADINRSTQAQAGRDWFYRPGTNPPSLAPPLLDQACEPISLDVVPGYSFEVATTSRRRTEADALLNRLIQSGATNELSFVVVARPAEPAATPTD